MSEARKRRGKWRRRHEPIRITRRQLLLGSVGIAPLAVEMATLTVSPDHGAPGIAVVLTGTGWGSKQSVRLTFDDPANVIGNVRTQRDGTFTFATTIPSTATLTTHTFTGTITRKNVLSTVTASAIFTVDTAAPPPPSPPTITSISPATGPSAGGTVVTVNGTNFSTAVGGNVVKFGSAAAAAVTPISATQLQATSPGGSGTVDITVTVGSLTSVTGFSDLFNYSRPTVTSLSPATGTINGGTAVTVSGTGFLIGGTTVNFGTGVATNVVVSSGTSLTCLSPSGSGTVDVTVSVNGMTSQVGAADLFTYTGSPPAFTTIQAAVDAASVGATINVPAGIYRERVTISKSLTVLGSPGADIRGSDVWTGWTQTGAFWTSTLTVPALGFTPHGNIRDQRALWPEQVFINEGAGAVEQTQLAPGSTPARGEFCLVSATDRHLRIGTNPTLNTVEVTVRNNWFLVNASDVLIDGFKARHAMCDAENGGIAVGSLSAGRFDRVTLRNLLLQYAHGRGFQFYAGSGHLVQDVESSYNGQSGGGLSAADGGVASGNRCVRVKSHHNNTQGFDPDWDAGGIKIFGQTDFTFDHCEASNNDGAGLWAGRPGLNGGTNHRVEYSTGIFHDNSRQGIQHESSGAASIHHNRVWECGWGFTDWGWGSGILSASCGGDDATHLVEIFSNILAWCADGIIVADENQDVPLRPPATNIYLHDNTIIYSPRAQDTSDAMLLGWLKNWSGSALDGGLTAGSDRAVNNRYWSAIAEPAPGNNFPCRFGGPAGCFGTLADFQAARLESGGRYLTTAEKDSVLSSNGMPLTPASLPPPPPSQAGTPVLKPGPARFGKQTLTAGQTMVGGSVDAQGASVAVEMQDNTTLDGVEIFNTGGFGGAVTVNGNGVNAHDCLIRNTSDAGMVMDRNGAANGIKNATITNILFQDTGGDAIHIKGTNRGDGQAPTQAAAMENIRITYCKSLRSRGSFSFEWQDGQLNCYFAYNESDRTFSVVGHTGCQMIGNVATVVEPWGFECGNMINGTWDGNTSIGATEASYAFTGDTVNSNKNSVYKNNKCSGGTWGFELAHGSFNTFTDNGFHAVVERFHNNGDYDQSHDIETGSYSY